MKKKVGARYFNKDYWMTPFVKSGYSPQQCYRRGDYAHEAIAQLLVELYGHEGKWLEAGCAFGWVVEQLINKGVDAWGFDISKYSIKNAPVEIECRLSRHDGLKTRYQELQDFDVIYSFETAEHIYQTDVLAWLNSLYHWLKPGGKMFLTICVGHNNARGIDDLDESHQTLQPREWWNTLLAEVGLVEDKKTFTKAQSTVIQTSRMVKPKLLVKQYGWHVFALRRGYGLG